MTLEEIHTVSEIAHNLENEGVKHFRAHEILFPGASHLEGGCAGLNTLPPDRDGILANLIEVAKVAEFIRRKLGSPVRVLSGYRSPAYNECIGGSSNSYHMRGMALDLQPIRADVKNLSRLARAARKDGVFQGGIGVYSSFVHIDIRGAEANWNG